MNLKKEFKPYFAFSKGSMKTIIEYRSNVLMGIIGQLIMVGVTFFLWKAIYSNSTEGIIKGFSLEEMIVYILVAFIVGGITSNDISHTVSKEVRDGTIAMSLIKPISFRRRVVFMGLGQFLISFLMFFIPSVLLISFYRIDKIGAINISLLVFFIISITLGFLINTYFSYLFGLLAFKFYNLWGISQIAYALINLVSGALIPLTFFPEVIQKIFGILPFSSIIYTPTMIYLGKLSTNEILISIGLQIFWIIIFLILSKFTWNKLIDKLSIQGG